MNPRPSTTPLDAGHPSTFWIGQAVFRRSHAAVPPMGMWDGTFPNRAMAESLAGLTARRLAFPSPRPVALNPLPGSETEAIG